MIEILIETPTLKEISYEPVQIAMVETGKMISDVVKGALTGAVLPGMTGPVTMDNPDVQYHNLGIFELEVRGPDVTAIEKGVEPFDMKPAIYSGPRHKVAKDGHWYVNVPFFHDRDKLPQNIRAMSDNLETSAIIGHYIDDLGVTRNTYRWGEQRFGLWRLPNMASTLTSLSVSSTGYIRKHSKYSGMVKMQGSGLMTFRTASEKSPPESWWNPGKPGNPVSESVQKVIEPLVQARLTAAWQEVFDQWLS